MLKVNLNEVGIAASGNSKTILKDVKLEADVSSIVSILGTNGVGKSTLIKAMTVLLDTNSYYVKGKSIFFGEDLLKTDIHNLLEIRKNRIKYVFQDSVNSFNPLKKLGYYFKNYESEKAETEKLLKEFLLPPGSELFNLYPFQLSGGMAQRTAFVLTLLAKPDLLILDEPTSAVDNPIANLFLLKLKQFSNEGGTVIIVTQDVRFAAEISNKIYFLADKSLSPAYSPKEFLECKSEPMLSFIQSYNELI